jgi:putative MATE family efflux protein
VAKDLTVGPVFKTILKTTLPMTWGMLSVITFNIADTYFIGQLGTLELAAMSLTFPVVMIFFSLALGTATAVSSVVARSLGENDIARVRRYTSDGLTFGLVSVSVFILMGYAGLDEIFTLLGANNKTLPIVKDYMEVWLAGMIFLTIPMAGNGALRAAGEMKIASMIMLVAAMTNIILDPILIFGLGPIPALGVKGAAIATVVARATTLFASLYFLHFRFRMLDVSLPKLVDAVKSWRKIMHIAIPTATTNLLAPVAFAVSTAIVARIGEAEIAAYGVVNRVESFAFIFIYALSAAIAPVIGQNFGAGKMKRVNSILNAGFVLCVLWCLTMSFLLILGGRTIMELFDSSHHVVNVGVFYLQIVTPSLALLAIRLISSAFYNAIGRPAMAAILGGLNLLVLFIPLVIIGEGIWGMNGVIYAHAVTNLLIGSASWIIVRIQIKRKLILV